MKEVKITFSCGHSGIATSALFEEGEEIAAPCRECKPGRLPWVFMMGLYAGLGYALYSLVVNDVAGAFIGTIAVAAMAVLTTLFTL